MGSLVPRILRRRRQQRRQNPGPPPLSIPPSGYWEGPDGPWSTFTIGIGSPTPQFINVLISTSSNTPWAIVPEGCPSTTPTNTTTTNNNDDYTPDPTCARSRGSLFDPSISPTWTLTGTYSLSYGETLGLAAPGLYGTDTLSLGLPGTSLPTLPQTTIAGVRAPEIWLGQLGINPTAVNFSSLAEPRASWLSSLKDEGVVRSLSWGYTAGDVRVARAGRGLGASLTLGGFDAARFVPPATSGADSESESGTSTGAEAGGAGEESTTAMEAAAAAANWPMGPDTSRDLLVAVRGLSVVGAGVTADGNLDVLPAPIYAAVDSGTPHIWLPEDVCDEVAAALGAVWDEEVGLYLYGGVGDDNIVDGGGNSDDGTDIVTGENLALTFTLAVDFNVPIIPPPSSSNSDPALALPPSSSSATGGSNTDTGTSVTILLPLSSLNLTLTPDATTPTTAPNPDTFAVPAERFYLPLRRAANSTQYTLGRAFLQRAYVVADYERRRFGVHAAVFPDEVESGEGQQQLVAIEALGALPGEGDGDGEVMEEQGGRALGESAIVGVAVAAGVVLVVLVVVVGLVWRRRRRRHGKKRKAKKKESNGGKDKDSAVEVPAEEKPELCAGVAVGVAESSSSSPVLPMVLPPWWRRALGLGLLIRRGGERGVHELEVPPAELEVPHVSHEVPARQKGCYGTTGGADAGFGRCRWDKGWGSSSGSSGSDDYGETESERVDSWWSWSGTVRVSDGSGRQSGIGPSMKGDAKKMEEDVWELP